MALPDYAYFCIAESNNTAEVIAFRVNDICWKNGLSCSRKNR